MVSSKHYPGQANLPSRNSTKSFWHSDPSKILLGHRTSDSLPTNADLVIIGSGISGASAAYHLSEGHHGKDRNIVMLEAREACWGATGRNGGHCQPMLYPALPEVGAFEVRNYEAIKTLVAEKNIPCDWKSLTGCHAFMSKSMFKFAVEEVKKVKYLDPELGKLITIVTNDSQHPSLDDLRIPKAAGATIQTKAASLWPYKLVAWILETLISSGSLNLQTNTPATHLEKVEDGSWIIHTPRGLLYSRNVLLTTNAYTSYLLPHFSDLIVPVRGEMSSLLPPISMRPASTTNQPLDHSYVFIGHGTQNINQDDYLVQRPFSTTASGGELMFGGGRSYASKAGVGVSDDSEIDLPAAAYLRRELNIVLDLQNRDDELKASHEWSGIMGFSRDGHPWVGEVGNELGVGGGKGLWVCAGFTGHGMPNTWLCGKAVVNLMMGKQGDEVDLPGPYRLSKERIDTARSYDEVHIADANATVL